MPGTSLKWTTNDEIEYINQLGSLGRNGRELSLDESKTLRKTKLAQYFRAALNRHNWGDIDNVLVMTYVRDKLKELEA